MSPAHGPGAAAEGLAWWQRRLGSAPCTRVPVPGPGSSSLLTGGGGHCSRLPLSPEPISAPAAPSLGRVGGRRGGKEGAGTSGSPGRCGRCTWRWPPRAPRYRPARRRGPARPRHTPGPASLHGLLLLYGEAHVPGLCVSPPGGAGRQMGPSISTTMHASLPHGDYPRVASKIATKEKNGPKYVRRVQSASRSGGEVGSADWVGAMVGRSRRGEGLSAAAEAREGSGEAQELLVVFAK